MHRKNLTVVIAISVCSVTLFDYHCFILSSCYKQATVKLLGFNSSEFLGANLRDFMVGSEAQKEEALKNLFDGVVLRVCPLVAINMILRNFSTYVYTSSLIPYYNKRAYISLVQVEAKRKCETIVTLRVSITSPDAGGVRLCCISDVLSDERMMSTELKLQVYVLV